MLTLSCFILENILKTKLSRAGSSTWFIYRRLDILCVKLSQDQSETNYNAGFCTKLLQLYISGFVP